MAETRGLLERRHEPWITLPSFLWLFVLFTIPAASLATAVLISTAVVTLVFGYWARWQEWLYRLWGGTVLFIFGARVKVRGAENLTPGSNYVIVSNHLSLVDTPVMFRCLPVPFKFLAKHELLKVPFIGWYLKRAGHLTVDRASLRSSITPLKTGIPPHVNVHRGGRFMSSLMRVSVSSCEMYSP